MAVKGPAGRVLFQARGLTTSFGPTVAVRDVDLAVVSGSVHALVGPSGAGKTTLLNLLSGYLVPDSGAVLVGGQDVTGRDPQTFRRLGVERCFAIANLFDAVPVASYVRLVLVAAAGEGAEADGADAEAEAEVDAVLAWAGLADLGGASLGSLGLPRRRSLELALTLAAQPRVVILDEPSAGLAPPEVDRLAERLARGLAGRAVLVADHNLRLVGALADTVSVLRAGRVVTVGSYGEVRPEVLLAAYADP